MSECGHVPMHGSLSAVCEFHSSVCNVCVVSLGTHISAFEPDSAGVSTRSPDFMPAPHLPAFEGISSSTSLRDWHLGANTHFEQGWWCWNASPRCWNALPHFIHVPCLHWLLANSLLRQHHAAACSAAAPACSSLMCVRLCFFQLALRLRQV